jgi:hypothetical protein
MHLNHYNNQIQKDELCFYGSISYLISGILYFYYLNSIKDCECVNDMYVYNVKKYFILAAAMYLINCVECTSGQISNLLSLLIILCGFGFVYSVRILINDIYEKNCVCADNKVTTVINILNYISIFMYLQYAVMIILLLLLLVSVPHENTEYSNKINNEEYDMDEDNEEYDMDEDGEEYDMDEDNEEYDMDEKDGDKIFIEIIKTLKSKKMNGGNVERLAKSFYNNNMTGGLKKILNKIS